MNQHATPTGSARDFCRILFRHKKKVVSLAVVILILTPAILVFYPRTYGSEAKLFVRVGRESVALDPTATQGRTINVLRSYENDIQSALEILNSRMLAESVVENVGVQRVLEVSDESASLLSRLLSRAKGVIQQLDPVSDKERAILKVQKTTAFSAPKDSGIISISCKAKSPQVANEIVDNLLEEFQAVHLRVSRTQGSHDFFTGQTAQQRKRLDEATLKLQEEKNRSGIVTAEGERALLLAQIGQVENEAIRARIDLAYSTGRVEDLEETVDALPETIVTETETGIGNVSTEGMRQQLYQLEIQERRQAARYTENHPAMIAVQKQREKAEKIYDAQPSQRTHTRKGMNATREGLKVGLLNEKATLTALQEKMKSLEEQRAKLEEELKAVNNHESLLANLQRQVDVAEANYRKYLDNLEQARIDQALQNEQVSSINVIQPASFVEKPVSPNKLIVIALGLLLAMIGPVCLALIAEYFNHSFTTPAQVERQLGLPVLVSIPQSARHHLSLN